MRIYAYLKRAGHFEMVHTDLINKIAEAKKTSSAIVSSLDKDKHYFVTHQPSGELRKVLKKPGAELIANAMGLVGDISEAQILQGTPGNPSTTSVVVRCKLINAQGNMVASGIGAYATSSYGMNTAAKMAAKSAFIDAVIRGTGISDSFTQDVNDSDELTASEQVQSSQLESNNYEAIVEGSDSASENHDVISDEQAELIKWIISNTPNYQDIPVLHGVSDLSGLSLEELIATKQDTIKLIYAQKEQVSTSGSMTLC